ncbi:PH domain-containing protein, partial [Riemerella anatipestifer]|uniref:PH domain-containing protein n=1 Tax=Riemerella anatipestifer TaxID=34085 RepID=UPI002097CA8F
VFKSSNSTEVNIITGLTLIILSLLIVTLFYNNIGEYVNVYFKFGVLLIISLVAIYFYANSLKKVKITDKYLILQKNIGYQMIPLGDIKSVNKTEFSNLTATFSSKGFFGFNGVLMDDTVTFVNDRKNMVNISTSKKKYLLSVNTPNEFIRDIINRNNNDYCSIL